jgi:hypothetical protein
MEGKQYVTNLTYRIQKNSYFAVISTTKNIVPCFVRFVQLTIGRQTDLLPSKRQTRWEPGIRSLCSLVGQRRL